MGEGLSKPAPRPSHPPPPRLTVGMMFIFWNNVSGFRFLTYCWIMTADINWNKWSLQCFRCCSGFFGDILDELLMRFWSNFGRPATPGKVHHCSMFSLFMGHFSHCGFVTVSSMIDGTDFFCSCWSCFCWSEHGALL